MSERVLVALGGGSRSAVAAALLKSEGYRVEGLFLDFVQGCSAQVAATCQRPDGIARVQQIAAALDIPMRAEALGGEYDDAVLDHLVHEFMQNRIPFPCLGCIGGLRLRALARVADRLGVQKIAMGLCARLVTEVDGRVRVNQGLEPDHDQSDLLSRATPELLSRLLLPTGNLSTRSVGQLAQEFGFPPTVAGRAGTTACYLDDGGYAQLIEQRVPETLRPKGMIRTMDSKVAGQHEGLHRHQLGARTFTEISPDGKDQKYVVVGFETSTQALIVGTEKNLLRKEFTANRTHWLYGCDGLRGMDCQVRLGIGTPTRVACRVVPFENDTAQVFFDSPQALVPPGQPVTFYRGEQLIGGAFMDRFELPGK